MNNSKKRTAPAANRHRSTSSRRSIKRAFKNIIAQIRAFVKDDEMFFVGIIAIIAISVIAAVVAVVIAQDEGKRPEGLPETLTAQATPPPAVYYFEYGDGCPINMAELTSAWASEAGFEQRYTLTDAERWELASVVTAEAGDEPLAGKMAVAQCVLQACEDDGTRPSDALRKYNYSKRRPDPSWESMEAVAAVFDFGRMATSEPIKYFYAPSVVKSDWHESQEHVLTINNLKFFKE